MLVRFLWTLLVCCAHITLTAAVFAQEPARIALLIGNKDYKPAVGPLTNTHKDVETVGSALRQLGFTGITIERDADYRKMDVAIRRHVDRLRRAGPGAIGFFYYSGHGVANPDTNANYLIPVDVARADTDDIWDISFEQSTIIDRLNRGAGQARHIIVFDACRDELNLTRAGQKALGAAKGFLPVADVRGMLIAYATAEKRTAADTGTFAKILAEEMVKPGVDAVSMFREVQLRAEREMNQEPWMSLRYLPRTFLAAPAATPPQPPSVPTPQPPLSDAATTWITVQNTESEAVLEEYIRKFGGSVYVDFARARLGELRKRKVAVGIAPEAPQPLCDGIQVSLGIGGSACLKAGAGKAFRDCPDCPQMVAIPAGRFQMGSPAKEEGRREREGPQHEVRIPNPFAMGQYEITVGQYLRCVGEGGCKPPEWQEKGSEYNIKTGTKTLYKSHGDALTGEDFPVVGVSWHDAAAYTAWLSKKTGRAYRLPNEAEWEYAARAGATGSFSFDGAITAAKANYNGSGSYAGSAKGEYRQRTMPVQSFQPNRWGLYQVHGNVWEWAQDCWNESYSGAPADGTTWTSGDCSLRVLRGGSWFYVPRILRSAFRVRYQPGLRLGSIGFRVSRTLNP